MNGAIGYNPEEVIEFYKYIETKIHPKNDELYNYSTENIINLISKTWYAPEAEMAYPEIEESFRELNSKIGYFNYDIGHMLSISIVRWGMATGTDPNPYRLPEIPSTTPPGPAPEPFVSSRSDGFRGVITENISQIIDNIRKWNVEISALLDEYDNAIISHENMFSGENQVQNLRQKISEIRGSIRETLDLTSEMVSKKMKETEEKYMQTAQANAQRFTGGN